MTHRITDEEIQQFVEAMIEVSQGSTEAENTIIEIAQNWDSHDDYTFDNIGEA